MAITSLDALYENTTQTKSELVAFDKMLRAMAVSDGLSKSELIEASGISPGDWDRWGRNMLQSHPVVAVVGDRRGAKYMLVSVKKMRCERCDKLKDAISSLFSNSDAERGD